MVSETCIVESKPDVLPSALATLADKKQRTENDKSTPFKDKGYENIRVSEPRHNETISDDLPMRDIPETKRPYEDRDSRQSIRTSNKNIEAELNKLESMNNELRERLKVAHRDDNKQIYDVNSQIQQLIEQNKQLSYAVDAFRKDMAIAERSKDRRQATENQDSRDIRTREDTRMIDERDRRIRELQERLKMANAKPANSPEYQRLIQDNESLNNQNMGLMSELDDLRQKIKDLESNKGVSRDLNWTNERLVEDKNAKLASLMDQNQRLERELAQYKNDIKKFNSHKQGVSSIDDKLLGDKSNGDEQEMDLKRLKNSQLLIANIGLRKEAERLKNELLSKQNTDRQNSTTYLYPQYRRTMPVMEPTREPVTTAYNPRYGERSTLREDRERSRSLRGARVTTIKTIRPSQPMERNYLVSDNPYVSANRGRYSYSLTKPEIREGSKIQYTVQHIPNTSSQIPAPGYLRSEYDHSLLSRDVSHLGNTKGITRLILGDGDRDRRVVYPRIDSGSIRGVESSEMTFGR